MKNTHYKIFSLALVLFSLNYSFLISNCLCQWVQNGVGFHNVWSLAHNGNTIFAGTSGQGVHLSTNNGTNWTQTSLISQTVWSLATEGSYIFAGTNKYGVHLSSDKGGSWTQTPLKIEHVLSLAVRGNNVFAGDGTQGLGGGLHLSTDYGTSWTQTPLNAFWVFSITLNGNYIFAGCWFGVYISTNNGISWTRTPLHETVLSLAVNGNDIFAGTNYGGAVYLSTNNGTSWTQTALNNRRIFSLAVNGNNIFAGTDSGVYASNNNGASWIQRNEGLPTNVSIDALCILNNYIFAAARYSGLYRRSLSELVDIKPISSEISKEFSLSQNYPNPFNPVTKIKFDVPRDARGETQDVKLVIFDVLGKEVMTLVNGALSPGSYETDFEGSNFASGMYFYKLEAGSFVETKRMMLLK